MATTKAVDLIERASLVIQDTGFVRWTKKELLGWLNDACKEIVVHRPDASTLYSSFSTVEGTRQILPAAALRLIDVVRNVNGAPITQVDRRILDEQLPTWHTVPTVPATAAEHFCYDPRDPKTFWLYPRVAAGIGVDVVYSTVPTEITSTTVLSDPNDLSDIASTVIPLDDSFTNAILDYMLFRAFSKDTEYAGNMQRAAMHLQGFATTLGIKVRMDAALSPSPSNPDANQVRG